MSVYSTTPEVRGANYLVAVSANPTREADVDFQMVDAALVLRQMEAAGTKLNVVMLDACRNNPFGGRGLRSSAGGLAQMEAPEGTLIPHATQPGNVGGRSRRRQPLHQGTRQSSLLRIPVPRVKWPRIVVSRHGRPKGPGIPFSLSFRAIPRGLCPAA